MKQYCEATKQLDVNRTEILNTFLQTEGNILENEAANNNLQEFKSATVQHLVKIDKIKVMQDKTDKIKVEYKGIAKHATVLFTTIQKLSLINHMYRYSLNWFSNLYISSIENSNKSRVLDKRLRHISDHLTFNCFTQLVGHCISGIRNCLHFFCV